MPDATVPLVPAVVEHRIPGRMRLRIPRRRGDAAFFGHVAAELAEVAGVRSVRNNPVTASVLIEHGGDAAEVLQAARERHLFAATEPTGASARAVAAFDALARWSPGRSPPRALNLAAAGLAGAELVQVARGRVVGSASENFWNAYAAYAMTGQGKVALLLGVFGLVQVMRGEVLGSATSLFLYALSARRMAQSRTAESTI